MDIVFYRRSRLTPWMRSRVTRTSRMRLAKIQDLHAVPRAIDAHAIRLAAEAVCIGADLQASVSRVDTALCAGDAVGIDLSLEVAANSDVNDLHVRVNMVQCESPVRDEPRSLLAERPIERSDSKPREILRPDPPPGFDGESLEDRIRMLLAPPISVELDTIAMEHEPKDFQALGVQWLMDRKSALLADEMGLGKTMQAILAARILRWRGEIDNILIVCPSPLVDNCCREVGSWWGSAGANMVVWSGGSNKIQWLRMCTDRHVVKIMSYPMLAREADKLLSITPRVVHDLIILDEAQKIKNPLSKTAKAVKALVADRRWALSGTPLENRVEDISSIFDFVKPGLIARNNRNDADVVRRAIGPYMLRRRAAEVLEDLPGLFQREVAISLDKEQRAAYKRAEDDGVVALNEKGDTIKLTDVFSLISKLRQICNYHPTKNKSAKYDQLRSDLDEITADGGKALVFSQYVEKPYGLKQLATDLRKHADSAYRVDLISGGVPVPQREGIIRTFQSDSKPGVLLLQYKAGGEGLNLQAAAHVFLYDRWWNPAVEDQAIKRAHRMGQKKAVLARKFMCVDTIEERIVNKLLEKRGLFSEVIDENNPAESMGITEEEMFQLFEKLTVRPKGMKPARPNNKYDWEHLDDQQFEKIVAEIYESHGYKVEQRGGPHDGGVDLLAEMHGSAASQKILIQCKRYTTPCGPDAVRSLKGAMAQDQYVSGRILALWGTASSAAKQEANRAGVVIKDGEELQRMQKGAPSPTDE